MKASLKLREEQKPLFKAKVPLNILGIPFQSSHSTGDYKELSLGLGTFFDSGPSFRLSYHPNDAFNPFSLLIKTGVGHFGSPINAPMTMTVQFNFLGNNTTSYNPRFFLHFNPHFGDFSLKKSQSSNLMKSNQNDTVFEVIEKPCELDNGDFFKGERTPLKSSVESVVSGMELGAKSVFPIRNGAVLKLRWGIKFPQGFQSLLKNPMAKISPHGNPSLVLNKIGIEHVAKVEPSPVVGPEGSGSAADLAETCFSVKRQLETLRSENGQLAKVLDDLRMEFGNRGSKRGKGVMGGERKIMELDIEGDVEISKA